MTPRKILGLLLFLPLGLPLGLLVFMGEIAHHAINSISHALDQLVGME
jgi:hypothetical protein